MVAIAVEGMFKWNDNLPFYIHQWKRKKISIIRSQLFRKAKSTKPIGRFLRKTEATESTQRVQHGNEQELKCFHWTDYEQSLWIRSAITFSKGHEQRRSRLNHSLNLLFLVRNMTWLIYLKYAMDFQNSKGDTVRFAQCESGVWKRNQEHKYLCIFFRWGIYRQGSEMCGKEGICVTTCERFILFGKANIDEILQNLKTSYWTNHQRGLWSLW